MIKIPLKTLPLPLFINVDYVVLNIVWNWSCLETTHFLCFFWFDLLEFQRFCLERSSCHSFNTSSSWCEYSRINHWIEFITGENVSSFFYFPWGFTHRSYWNKVWSLVISDYVRKITNQLWIKNLQKLPRKKSLSLTQRKVTEKNKGKLSN